MGRPKLQEMADCHPDRPYYSKGLCKACYHAKWGLAYEQLPKCKVYRAKYSSESRKNNPEKYRGRDVQWRINNPDKAREKDKRQHDRKRLRDTGWSAEKIEATMLGQNGVCAICRESIVGAPHADHEHILPPKPRALLCFRCNLALGQFRDSAILCEAATNYLKEWGTKDYKETQNLCQQHQRYP